MSDIAKARDCEIHVNEHETEWDSFVARHSQGKFYQRYGWRKVVETSFGHRAHFLSAMRGGEIAGVLPLAEIKSALFGHSLVSTPFCVGGGPLADDIVARDTLLQAAEKLGRDLGVGYVEIRDTKDLPAGWLATEGQYSGFERVIAPGEEDCLKQIPRKQRAVVRHALEKGLAFTIDGNITDFYRLHSRTFRNHGTPIFPQHYYRILMTVFGKDCDILTVRKDGRPICSVMNFYLGARVTPYYTGNVDEARSLGANDFMYWKLMRHAAKRGCTIFDFGRSKVGTGPHDFKKNWGFEPRPISNSYYLIRRRSLPNISPANPKFSLAIKTWQKLPLPIANFLSQFISPSLA